MATTSDDKRYLHRKLAHGYLELWDKFSHGKSINTETMGVPTAGGGAGDDFLYDGLISFMSRFENLDCYCLKMLYRPDIRIKPNTAMRLGHKLRPAWKLVEPDEKYFESVVDAYNILMNS